MLCTFRIRDDDREGIGPCRYEQQGYEYKHVEMDPSGADDCSAYSGNATFWSMVLVGPRTKPAPSALNCRRSASTTINNHYLVLCTQRGLRPLSGL